MRRGETCKRMKDLFKRFRGKSQNKKSEISSLTISKADEIVDEFTKFLVEGQPHIHDEALLPKPKREILAVFEILRKHYSDLIESKRTTDTSAASIKKYEEYLESLKQVHFHLWLSTYSTIEPSDKKSVTYFNSFKNSAAIPTELRSDYIRLTMKYNISDIPKP